jgi:hypothetical protein
VAMTRSDRGVIRSTLIWLNGPFWFSANHQAMNKPDELDQDKPRPKPSRSEEALRIIAEYQNGLQEIVKKLRQRPLN